MVHVVYCNNKTKVLSKILSGEKSMIVRGAAGRKIPHSRVFQGETLYFMEKGSKKISARAKVSFVENHVKIPEETIYEVFDKYEKKMALTSQERKRWHKKCLCLVAFEDVKEIEALDFDHQGNMDDWLIIEKIEDVLVGTSIPYNYDKSKFKK